MLERIHPLLDRRAFLSQSATALSGAALAQLLRRDGLLAAEVERARPIRPKIDPANPTVLDDLSELVDRSLVLFDARTFRYRLHDLMKPIAAGLFA